MTDLFQQLAVELQKQIETFQPTVAVEEVGYVIEAGDGIARATGLPNVRAQELVQFENGTLGIAFNLEKDNVGIIIMGTMEGIREGTRVFATGRIASVPVGEGLIGRVINPLGQPLDGKGPIRFEKYRPLERIAPRVMERKDVDTPVHTGIKAIDAMIPIGRGQRELIIGDRQTGKTAIALDAIVSQRMSRDMICIYVAIGQKKSLVARIINELEALGAMEYTIVVVASAEDPAALQYLAPYAGCAIGEEFMEQGKDVLVVYDDLSKHAWAYREVSLLMRRPPGREAYPGDVFYLHSRLLERAARLADHYVIVPKDFESEDGMATAEDRVEGTPVFDGPIAKHEAEQYLEGMENKDAYKIVKVRGTGGSLTALPIIETLLGDVSAYIPTNVISITDGQIYLETGLFNAGIRPAINVGISVSRVGGDAQTKIMKKVAGQLRLDMAAFRELAAFAQFAAELDPATQAKLNRGLRLQELLKQPRYSPMSLAHEILAIYGGTRGYLDSVPVERVAEWERALIRFVEDHYPDLIERIETVKELTPDIEEQMKKALEEFMSTWK